MRLRPGCLVAVLVCAAGVSGCGGASQVTTDTRISLSGQTQEQHIDLADLTVTVEVPVELGSLRPDNRADDCPTSRESFGTIPTGSTDHDPKLFFATTSVPCPDEQCSPSTCRGQPASAAGTPADGCAPLPRTPAAGTTRGWDGKR